MTNLVKRILVGAVGIPVTIGAIYAHPIVFSCAMVLVSMLGLWEFYHLAESKHAQPSKYIGLLANFILQGGIVLSVLHPAGWTVLGVVGILITLIVMGTELFRAKENALLNVAMTMFGIVYITLSMSSLILMRSWSFEFGYDGADLIATLFAGVWACDSAAYFTGLSIGKHKLFPRVSPKKTWEGAIGGAVGAVATTLGMFYWLMPQAHIGHAVVIGLIIAVFGPIGDLSESLLKRDATVKDSSHILPGHGGLMDRFDSMMFIAPMVLVYLWLVRGM